MLLSLSKLFNLTLPKAPRPERVAFLKAQPFAHRGLHGGAIVENSRAAFSAAIAVKHGIELDVQLASNFEPFVFHDETLDRLTAERGRISDFTGPELAATKLFGTHETIPRLSEILALVDGRVPILIEVKSNSVSVNHICLAVRRALEGYTGDVAVMSFDPRIGHWFAQHADRIPRGLVMTQDKGEKAIERLKIAAKIGLSLRSAKPDFIAYDIDYLTTRVPTALRNQGLPLLTWTVRTAAQERLALSHADEIIYEKRDR
jgi:glycerophosphoryl diester phosphodiesterase